jgi:phosphoribosylcarboxyaminoimidazole (NCAIR) mutase
MQRRIVMRMFPRIVCVAALLLVSTALNAQTSTDLPGHWAGTILAPVTGLPLTSFAVEGRSVTFQVKRCPEAAGVQGRALFTQGPTSLPLTFRRAK